MSVSSFAQTLSTSQRDYLIALIEECRVLGATNYELSPLLAVLYVADKPLSHLDVIAAKTSPKTIHQFD